MISDLVTSQVGLDMANNPTAIYLQFDGMIKLDTILSIQIFLECV
jgi:hypothetical protein